MGNESAKANCSPLRRRPYRPAPRERPGAASGVTSSVVRHVWPLRGEPTMTRQFSTANSSSQILVPRSCGTLMLHPPRTELRCQFFDWVGAVVSRVRAWACLCRRIRRAQWIIAGLIDLAINNLSRNRRRCVLAPFRLRDGAARHLQSLQAGPARKATSFATASKEKCGRQLRPIQEVAPTSR